MTDQSHSAAGASMRFVYRTVDEPRLGPKWRAEFEARWPGYRRWFYRQGEARRPTYRTSLRALRAHMPELEESYQRMVELAGGSDSAARFLAQYCPPAFFAACSQLALSDGEPALVRNYDYSPLLADGLVMRTRWNGQRVVGMLDSMSGVLDGMNESGLAVSLAFGGRRMEGEGFGIGLVLRYVLELCTNVGEAVRCLERTPVHLAYNIALLDAEAEHATVWLAPGEPAVVTKGRLSTNHQGEKCWPRYARHINSHGRYRHLERLSRTGADANTLAREFLRPPLFSNAYASGYGTIYTAAYLPRSREIRYLWPGCTLKTSVDDFEERRVVLSFEDPSGTPIAVPERSPVPPPVSLGTSAISR